MGQRVQCAVFGATGYSGFELVRLLARHDGAEKPLLPRNVDSAYKDLSEACPQLAGNGGFPFESFSWQRMKDAGVDVLFLATPHEFSRELVPQAVSRGFRVIDLSGAWRLKDAGHRGGLRTRIRAPQLSSMVKQFTACPSCAPTKSGRRSCIDNLLEGAAGQAVQNMNLMFGFDEKAGLQ